jgi:hypothetical protein
MIICDKDKNKCEDCKYFHLWEVNPLEDCISIEDYENDR